MCAVCHCEATIDGKTTIATVKEKEEAQAAYDGNIYRKSFFINIFNKNYCKLDAISAGKGAYLLEKESDNIFSMSVGNLAPKQTASIKVK